MKRSIKILNVIVFAIIYCFAVDVNTNPDGHPDFQNNLTTSQEQYFLNSSTNLFYYISESESLVINYNNLPTLRFKKALVGFWVINQTTEKLFKTAFSQHANISRNFLIALRKLDIIFPFHYFW